MVYLAEIKKIKTNIFCLGFLRIRIRKVFLELCINKKIFPSMFERQIKI